MNNRAFGAASRAPGRPPVLLWLVVVALAVYLSGCCGSCCRAMLGEPGGGSTDSGGISSTPESGSVGSLVANEVGAFRLVGTAPVTRLGARLQPGVIDSIGAVYTGPRGEKLNQIVLAYASSAVASARMDAVYQVLSQQCGGKRLMRKDILNASGAVIGKQVVCDSDPQHVYWSNGRILTFVTAPHPAALEFHNASGH